MRERRDIEYAMQNIHENRLVETEVREKWLMKRSISIEKFLKPNKIVNVCVQDYIPLCTDIFHGLDH